MADSSTFGIGVTGLRQLPDPTASRVPEPAPRQPGVGAGQMVTRTGALAPLSTAQPVDGLDPTFVNSFIGAIERAMLNSMMFVAANHAANTAQPLPMANVANRINEMRKQEMERAKKEKERKEEEERYNTRD